MVAALAAGLAAVALVAVAWVWARQRLAERREFRRLQRLSIVERQVRAIRKELGWEDDCALTRVLR